MKKMKKSSYPKADQTYQTKDLYEAAFLYAKGQKLICLERPENARFFWFIFKDKTQCEELANSYWAGDCVVNAKAYSDAFRTLKDRIFSQR